MGFGLGGLCMLDGSVVVTLHVSLRQDEQTYAEVYYLKGRVMLLFSRP
jgi:hypothetical protein